MSNLEPMPEIDPLTEFGVAEPDFSWDDGLFEALCKSVRQTKRWLPNECFTVLQWRRLGFGFKEIFLRTGIHQSIAKVRMRRVMQAIDQWSHEDWRSSEFLKHDPALCDLLKDFRDAKARRRLADQTRRWKAQEAILKRTVKSTGPHQINCFDHTAKQICQRLMAIGFFRSSTGKWLRNHGRVRCVEFFVLPDEFNQQDKRRFRVLATLL